MVPQMEEEVTPTWRNAESKAPKAPNPAGRGRHIRVWLTGRWAETLAWRRGHTGQSVLGTTASGNPDQRETGGVGTAFEDSVQMG